MIKVKRTIRIMLIITNLYRLIMSIINHGCNRKRSILVVAWNTSDFEMIYSNAFIVTSTLITLFRVTDKKWFAHFTNFSFSSFFSSFPCIFALFLKL